MILQRLSSKEFQLFADGYCPKSFLQSQAMFDSQQQRNQESIIYGLKENDEVLAAAIVVLNKLKFGVKTASIVYGPLINYEDKSLVTKFFKGLEKILSKKKIITLSVAPNLEVRKYDDDFNETVLYDDTEVIKMFKELGYEHFNQEISDIHNNWIMVKDLTEFSSEAELFESFSKKTKNRARKAQENQIEIDVLKYDELDRFYAIEEYTSETRDFVSRNLKYFESVYEQFDKTGSIRVTIARINLKKLKEESDQRLEQAQSEVDNVQALIAENDTPRNQKKLNAANDVYQAAQKQNQQLEELLEKYTEEWVDAATRYYLSYGDEMVCLAGGALLDLDFLQPTVALYVDAMNWALEKGFKRYNYYGIYTQDDTVGSVSPILHFKKGFGGEIVNLVGNFEKVLNPGLYKLYSSIKKVLNR